MFYLIVKSRWYFDVLVFVRLVATVYLLTSHNYYVIDADRWNEIKAYIIDYE